MNSANPVKPITSAVMINGAESRQDTGMMPIRDIAVHIFQGPDLVATAKFPNVPIDAIGDLQNFLNRYAKNVSSL